MCPVRSEQATSLMSHAPNPLLHVCQRLALGTAAAGLLFLGGCDEPETEDDNGSNAGGKADEDDAAFRVLDVELDRDALAVEGEIENAEGFERSLGVAAPEDLNFETHSVVVYQAEIPVNGGWEAAVVNEGQNRFTLGCRPAQRMVSDVVVVAVPLEGRGETEIAFDDEAFEANGCEATAETLKEIGALVDVTVVRPNLLEPLPERYTAPNVGTVSMGGLEFRQKWSGGHNPTFSFNEGSELGRRCAQASAERFTAIMEDLPEEYEKLHADSTWGGSFFNWNDDFSGENSFGDAVGPRLWGWRPHLIKWISQTSNDGACLLPTRELALEQANTCLATAQSNDGKIQGCRAQG